MDLWFTKKSLSGGGGQWTSIRSGSLCSAPEWLIKKHHSIFRFQRPDALDLEVGQQQQYLEGLFPERLGCRRIGKPGLFHLQWGRARRRILGADQPKQCAWKYGIQPTPGFLMRIIHEAIWTNLKNVSKHNITTRKKRKICNISKAIIYHYKFIWINAD